MFTLTSKCGTENPWPLLITEEDYYYKGTEKKRKETILVSADVTK